VRCCALQEIRYHSPKAQARLQWTPADHCGPKRRFGRHTERSDYRLRDTRPRETRQGREPGRVERYGYC